MRKKTYDSQGTLQSSVRVYEVFPLLQQCMQEHYSTQRHGCSKQHITDLFEPDEVWCASSRLCLSQARDLIKDDLAIYLSVVS